MTLSHPPELIRLLAHDLRWGMLKALTESDLRVNELVERVGQPINLVSYHLKKMRADGLVTTRRSEADGRDVYYSVDMALLAAQFQQAGRALHPAIAASPAPAPDALPRQRILFVCTHNSARSQMAEGWMRALSAGRVDVISAGSQPTRVHPEAIAVMAAHGVDISRQGVRALDAVAGQSFDVIITVCDRAREVCPVFPGDGVQLHWGFPDPLAHTDPQTRHAALNTVALRLRSRINWFLSALVNTEG